MRPKHITQKRKNLPPSPNIIDTERYERLLEIFEELAELNSQTPVIVEGKRDAEALRELGLEGRIIVYNTGVSLHEFSESVLEEFDRVVLLMDWDSSGQSLQNRLARELSGYWEDNERYRRLLRVLCQKEIKDIEGIPGLIRRLSLNAISRPEG